MVRVHNLPQQEEPDPDEDLNKEFAPKEMPMQSTAAPTAAPTTGESMPSKIKDAVVNKVIDVKDVVKAKVMKETGSKSLTTLFLVFNPPGFDCVPTLSPGGTGDLLGSEREGGRPKRRKLETPVRDWRGSTPEKGLNRWGRAKKGLLRLLRGL